jgi:hypothetical protein
MPKKGLIIGGLLVLTLTFQVGCTKTESKKGTNSETNTKQEMTQVLQENDVNNNAKAVEEFNDLVKGNGELSEIIEFIDKNVSIVSKEDASKMILKLEESQREYLPKLELEYNDKNIYESLVKEYTAEFDINNIQDIEDQDLKNLLTMTREKGFTIDMTEGYYYPVINYDFYNKYKEFVTSDIEEYITIMAVESGKVPAKDGGLIISWDELLERAYRQEKFINNYKDSVKLEEIKKMYKRYLTFVLRGIDNTPLYSYDTKQLKPEVKDAYSNAVKTMEQGNLHKALSNFLEILEKNNYKLTEEVDSYTKNELQKLD